MLFRFLLNFFLIPIKSLIMLSFFPFCCLCQNPPLQLSVDTPSASEIEVDTDGVWSIVGGKVKDLYLVIFSLSTLFFCHCQFLIKQMMRFPCWIFDVGIQLGSV